MVPFVEPKDDPPPNAAPLPSGKWLISVNGGMWPMWSDDGKELLYLAPNKTLMAAKVQTKADSFEVLEVEPLFVVNTNPLVGMNYDLSSDGQRVVVNTFAAETNIPITLATNWTPELNP